MRQLFFTVGVGDTDFPNDLDFIVDDEVQLVELVSAVDWAVNKTAQLIGVEVRSCFTILGCVDQDAWSTLELILDKDQIKR